MKKGCLWIIIIGLVFLFLALLGTLTGDKDDSANSKEKENKYLISNGTYRGYHTCSCCGNNAPKQRNVPDITVKNISENKVSFFRLEYQQREIIGTVVNGKIIIDERQHPVANEMIFWGTVDVQDKNTITINVQWTDPTGANLPNYEPNKVLNKCAGTYTKIE
jgi:hypothetical protein